MSIQEHEKQFRKLLAEHTGLLLKVIRSFAADQEDADDLFQEIVLQVWLALPSFRGDAKATTWLYRVALNTAVVWKRKETTRRRKKEELTVSDLTVQSISISEATQNDAVIEQLYAAIRSLPTTKRALVVLYLDGFTYKEMAEVLGLSESNIGATLNRTKTQIEKMLQENNEE